MYAIVQTGGRQHKAEPGRIIKTDKLSTPVGEEVVLDRVLAVYDGEKLRVGTPYLEGVRVIGRVVQQGRDPKIRVQRFKRKKHYRRLTGHRQPFSVVQVNTVEGL